MYATAASTSAVELPVGPANRARDRSVSGTLLTAWASNLLMWLAACGWADALYAETSDNEQKSSNNAFEEGRLDFDLSCRVSICLTSD